MHDCSTAKQALSFAAIGLLPGPEGNDQGTGGLLSSCSQHGQLFWWVGGWVSTCVCTYVHMCIYVGTYVHRCVLYVCHEHE